MLSCMQAESFDVQKLLREAAWVRSLARGLTTMPERASELEQETWLAVLYARPTTDSGLRPWLATVMRNAARAIARNETHRADRERSAARAESLPSAQELAERAELQRTLVEQVLALEEPYRSTVLLCFYEGLTPGAIALRQGIPAGSVRSRLSRGVDLLRRRLDHRSLAGLLPLGSVPSQDEFPWTALLTGIAVKKIAWVAVAACVLMFSWYLGRSDTDSGGAVPTEIAAKPELHMPGAAEVLSDGVVDPSARREVLSESVPFRAAANALRLRLVDERTNESVPAYAVAIVSEQPALAGFVSDADGELEIELPQEGRFRLDLLEALGGSDLIQTSKSGAVASRITVELADPVVAAPQKLRIPVGPTYRLDMTPPPGRGLKELEASLKSADARFAFDVARTHVRAGVMPWLRFGPGACLVAAGPPWKLELRTRDGLWYAAALVDQRIGIVAQPVSLLFEPRARLFGHLRDAEGRAIEREYVRLEREGASFDNPNNRPLMSLTKEGGLFDFRAISPGPWILSFAPEGREKVQLEVSLGDLESRELDLTLDAALPLPLARIEGTISSSTGRYGDAVYVSLLEIGPQYGRGAQVEWQEIDGRRHGRFVAENLRPGKYRVSARVPGLLSVEPAFVEVEANDGPLHFVVRDDIEVVSWHVRAVANNTAVRQFRVTLSSQGLSSSASTESGLAVIGLIPKGASGTMALRADGYAPCYAEIVVDGTSSPDQAVSFELTPGWGTEVTVVDTQRRPIAEARLYFDDMYAGKTDEHGRARIALPNEPQVVRVEYLDWHLAASSTIARETGKFRSWEPFLHVVLEP